MGLHTVPVLYRGPWDPVAVRLLDGAFTSQFGGEREGYVARLAGRFHYRDFRRSVAKYVRKDHVTTNDHWLHKEVVANKLQVDVS